MTEKRLLKFWAGISLFAILNLIVFDLVILRAPDVLQVQYTPDDAYYYLSLARNFVRFQTWTFDSGVSLTTGFHPLWAYVLVFFYWILQPTMDGFVRISLILSGSFTAASMLILFWQGWKYQQPVMLASLAILIVTRNVLLNSISGLEWSLLVLIIVLYCITFIEKHTTRMGRILLFILALLGSTARSDFGLLPLIFVLASLIVLLWRKNGEFIKASLCGLTGAVAGVGIVFLHNYSFTGLALQSSALMKSHWMKADTNFYPLLLGGLGLLFLLLIPVLAGNLEKRMHVSDLQYMLGSSALFSWIGYALFYSRNSDVQPWYSVNILFAAFIFLCVLWNAIQYGRLAKYKFMPYVLFAVIFAGVFLRTCMSIYPVNERNSEWTHQQAFLEAGKYLHDHPPGNGRVGAWNAGIVNYYQGGGVVNLDGLVNNDIYPYAITNSSYDYVQKINMRYVVDFDVMFGRDILERSGYDDPRFTGGLIPIFTFNQKKYPVVGYLTLYELRIIK